MSRQDPMTRWNLFLPDSMIEKVKAVADSKNCSASYVVRTAVSKYLDALARAEAVRAAQTTK